MELVMNSFSMFLPLILFALNLVSKGGSANNNCEGKPNNCCDGYMFDIITNSCKECDIGFFGQNCSEKCPSRTYGRNCQKMCRCVEPCHHVYGCDLVSTLITPTSGEIEKSVEASETSTSQSSVFDWNHPSPASRPISNRLHWEAKLKPSLNHRTNNPGHMNHGLYAIVISNTLLTLPVTIVVIIFICRKFKKRRRKFEIQVENIDNDDVCYNDLNEINTCVKISEYDALSNCMEHVDDTSTASLVCLENGPIQRKARQNSYVPVKEKKAKENDETMHNKDIYAKVKRKQTTTNCISMDNSITIETMESDTTTTDHQSINDESLYIVPLQPTVDEPGIHIKSLKSSVSICSTDVKETENTDKEGNIYTDLM